jgi:hypothetical protein
VSRSPGRKGISPEIKLVCSVSMSVVAYRIFVPCERMAQVPSPHNLFERRRHTFSKWEKIGEQLLLRVIFCCCMQVRARVALQLCWGARVWWFPKNS